LQFYILSFIYEVNQFAAGNSYFIPEKFFLLFQMMLHFILRKMGRLFEARINYLRRDGEFVKNGFNIFGIGCAKEQKKVTKF